MEVKSQTYCWRPRLFYFLMNIIKIQILIQHFLILSGNFVFQCKAKTMLTGFSALLLRSCLHSVHFIKHVVLGKLKFSHK